MKVIWDETSCCGEHRTGRCTFDDGEVIYVKECGDGKHYVKALLNGMWNKDSLRVNGGEAFDVTEADIKKIK